MTGPITTEDSIQLYRVGLDSNSATALSRSPVADLMSTWLWLD